MFIERKNNIKKTFTIECTMEERWIDTFCSMLKKMENNGNLGHSEEVGIYSDGDGDFRPKFKIETDFKKVEPIRFDEVNISRSFYDAG